MDDRDLVLRELPPGTSTEPPPFFQRPRTYADLWLEFDERLVPLGGEILPPQMLPLILKRGFFADDDVRLESVAAGLALQSVWDAEVGVCWAEFAVAETGTLVVSAGPGRYRLTSLAPPVNVLLVREDAIVATLEEAFARISKQTSVLITGTSRTADIEGVLVRGVHGPRELYVVRI